jgi:hypothetical protein
MFNSNKSIHISIQLLYLWYYFCDEYRGKIFDIPLYLLILISALIHINEYDNDIRTCILNIKKRFEFNDNIINYLKNLNLVNIDIKNKENILNKYLSIENNDKPLKQHIVYLLYLLNDDLSLFNNFTNSKKLYTTIKKYNYIYTHTGFNNVQDINNDYLSLTK